LNRKLLISLAAGIVLSCAGFYLALRNVPVSDLVAYMGAIQYVWLIPAVFLGLFTFVLRALRWRIILSTSVDLSFSEAFHPMMTGFLINTILPGRVGEVARPAIINKRDKVPFTLGLSTIAAERVFDLVSLISLLGIVMSFVSIDPGFRITFKGYSLDRTTLDHITSAMTAICALLIAAIIAVSIPAVLDFAKKIISAMPSMLFFAGAQSKQKVYEKISIPLMGILDNISAGLSMVKYPKKIIACIIYSFLVWGLQACALYVMAKGCPGIDLTFTQLTAVFVILCFFIALPSVPGFWGLWEAGGVFGLALFGIGAKNAAGFALASHAVMMFPMMILGMISAMIIGVNILDVSFPGAEKVG